MLAPPIMVKAIRVPKAIPPAIPPRALSLGALSSAWSTANGLALMARGAGITNGSRLPATGAGIGIAPRIGAPPLNVAAIVPTGLAIKDTAEPTILVFRCALSWSSKLARASNPLFASSYK